MSFIHHSTHHLSYHPHRHGPHYLVKYIDKHREVWQALGVLYLYLLVEGPVSVGCVLCPWSTRTPCCVTRHIHCDHIVSCSRTDIQSRHIVTSSIAITYLVDRSAVANRHHIATSSCLPPSVPPPLHIWPVTLLAQAVDSFLPPSRFAPYLDACPRFSRSRPRATPFSPYYYRPTGLLAEVDRLP